MTETDIGKFKDPKSVLNSSIFRFIKVGDYSLAFVVLHGLNSLEAFSAEKIKYMLSGIAKLIAKK